MYFFLNENDEKRIKANTKSWFSTVYIPSEKHAAEITTTWPSPESNSLRINIGKSTKIRNTVDLIGNGILREISVSIVFELTTSSTCSTTLLSALSLKANQIMNIIHLDGGEEMTKRIINQNHLWREEIASYRWSTLNTKHPDWARNECQSPLAPIQRS